MNFTTYCRKHLLLLLILTFVSSFVLSGCDRVNGDPSVYEDIIMESPVRIEIYMLRYNLTIAII